MQGAPVRPEHPLVQRLADQRVRETDAHLGFGRAAAPPAPVRASAAASPRPVPTAAQRSSGASCPMIAAATSARRASAPSRSTRASITCRRRGGTRAPARSPSVHASLPVTLRHCPTQRARLLQCPEQFARIEGIALRAPRQIRHQPRLIRRGEEIPLANQAPQIGLISGCTSMSVARASRASAGSAR